jgi:hypothetical protein
VRACLREFGARHIQFAACLFGCGARGFGIRLRAVRIGLRPTRLGARLIGFGSCALRISACVIGDGLRPTGIGTGLIRVGTCALRFHARMIGLSLRLARLSARLIGLGSCALRVAAGSVHVSASLLGLVLSDAPRRVQLLLGLRPKLLETFSELGDPVLRGPTQLLGMLLGSKMNAGDFRFRVSANVGGRSFRRSCCFLAIERRKTNRLL